MLFLAARGHEKNAMERESPIAKVRSKEDAEYDEEGEILREHSGSGWDNARHYKRAGK